MALLKTLLANSQHEPALRMARGLMGLPVAPQQQHRRNPLTSLLLTISVESLCVPKQN
jgi:hypothetical protein